MPKPDSVIKRETIISAYRRTVTMKYTLQAQEEIKAHVEDLEAALKRADDAGVPCTINPGEVFYKSADQIISELDMRTAAALEARAAKAIA